MKTLQSLVDLGVLILVIYMVKHMFYGACSMYVSYTVHDTTVVTMCDGENLLRSCFVHITVVTTCDGKNLI